MDQKFKQDKGVAGLTILMSLIVMLFVIGLLVMIFTIMGARMRDATYLATTVTVADEDIGTINETAGETLVPSGARNFRNVVVTGLINDTASIGVGNVTVSNGIVLSTNDELVDVFLNYTYVWDADTTATDVMNDTYTSIGGVTDWFSLFIVIGAMVVLILLTVIIITAIKSSGMVAGAGSTDDVGTA